MARYIDADFLIEQLQPAKNSLWNKNDHSKSMSEMIEDFCTELKNAPAADVVPKSEGEWGFDGMSWTCSECGEYAPVDKYGQTRHTDYCPNCGAKMSEGRKA